jgi:hypothetical protein
MVTWKDMPARRESAGLAIFAWTQRVRLFWSMRLSIAETVPVNASLGFASGRAWISVPTLTAAAKRSGTQKSTRMLDRSSIVAMADWLVT